MAVFGRLRMPSLGGATGWLNSEPLGSAELQGLVFSCASLRHSPRGCKDTESRSNLAPAPKRLSGCVA
jgi:hypothetical protein